MQCHNPTYEEILDSFKNGLYKIVKSNPTYRQKVPDYTVNRFCAETPSDIKDFRALNSSELGLLDCGKADTDRFTIRKQIRSNGSFDPVFCSKWLGKDSIRSRATPSLNEIFVSVETIWDENQTNMIYALNKKLNAQSGDFEAIGYVAFPPVLKDEIWSISWIQGVKASDYFVDYENQYRFYNNILI